MRQFGLTLITEVLPGKEKALTDFLNAIGDDISHNPWIRFEQLSLVHFLRWVVLPGDEIRGKKIPPQLVLSTNFDGAALPHLRELALKAEKGIRAIYAHCKDYPAKGNLDDLVDYLYRHHRKNAALYVGTQGRPVLQIQEESQIWEKLQDHLQDSNPSQDWEGKPIQELHQECVDHILRNPAFDFAKEKYKAPAVVRFGMAMLTAQILVFLSLFIGLWIWQPFIAAILTGISIVLIALLWTALRQAEKKDAHNFRPAKRDANWIENLNRREDHKVQNQITHLVTIKPGLARQLWLRLVLWAIGLLAKYMFNKGNLAGIPSIHFARWAIIDGGRRLLFFSNYDGSWESYLGEFVDRAAVGLTGVWSNSEGFPPTKNLIQEGARRSGEFKAWTRSKQIQTQVWYSAYKTLSVQNILNNTEIRQGLSGELDQEKCQAWLERL